VTAGLDASGDARPAVAAGAALPAWLDADVEKLAGRALDDRERAAMRSAHPVAPAWVAGPCKPDVARFAERSCAAAALLEQPASLEQPTRAQTAAPTTQLVALQPVLWILLGRRPAEPRDVRVLLRTVLTRRVTSSERSVSPQAEPVESLQRAASQRDGPRFAA
jgi:hypothetical protein